jgi:hypothetical protein
LDAALNLSDLVHLECLGRRAVDHGAGGDVEPGAVALAHDGRPRQQPAGERASLVGAGADVVERVEAIVYTSDPDPCLAVVQVVGNDAVVRDGFTGPTVWKASAASSVIVYSSPAQ